MMVTRALERHRRRAIREARRHRSVLINTNQKVVTGSFFILILTLLVFGGFVYWSLYQKQDYSFFMYNITRVVPVPVARVGSTLVRYRDYLHHLRRQLRYYETQFAVDFSVDNQLQDAPVSLAEIKNQALQRAVDRVYVAKLANQYNLNVSDEEIDEQLALLQAQNKLGTNLQDVENVLNAFWGLTTAEYRRLLADELLERKVIRRLDVELGNNVVERMQAVEHRLNGGADFSRLAEELSDDFATAVNGGEYEFSLALNESDEHPLVLEAIFATPIGHFSEIIDTGRRLEIVKVLSDEGDGRRRAAHIRLNYVNLSDALRDIREREAVDIFITDVKYFTEDLAD